MTSLPLFPPVNSWPHPQDTPVSHLLCCPPLFFHESTINHVHSVQESQQHFIVCSDHQKASYCLLLFFSLLLLLLMLTLACTRFLHLQPGLCADTEQKSEILLLLFLGHDGASALNNWKKHFSQTFLKIKALRLNSWLQLKFILWNRVLFWILLYAVALFRLEWCKLHTVLLTNKCVAALSGELYPSALLFSVPRQSVMFVHCRLPTCFSYRARHHLG